MKVGVIGPHNSVFEVECTITQAGLPVVVLPLNYQFYTEVPGILGKHQKEVDAVLFTGQIPFDYAMRYTQPEKPWGYLIRDKLSLALTLFKAGYVKKYNITKISIDNCEERLLYDTYRDIGYNRDEILVKLSSHSIFSSSYIKELIDFHTNHYQHRETLCCITGVDYVCRELEKTGVPCIMNSKSYDTIVQEINRLLMNLKIKYNASDDFATMSIDIDFLEEHPVYSRNVIQLLHLKNQVKDYIYIFAQKIGASIFDITGDKFYLCTNIGAILNETDELRRVEMFEAILEIDLIKNVFIGVGVGATAFQSQYHADLAKRHAKTFGISSIYMVHNDRGIAGPIVAGTEKSCKIVMDRDMKTIAQQTNIGVKTISKLDLLIRQYGIEFVTPKQLSALYGCSLRNMHRLLCKLENAGYVVEVGQETQECAGRPSRIFKINIGH
jgi:hypothetical protein